MRRGRLIRSFIFCAVTWANVRTLELRAQIDPAPTRAAVTIEGVATPFRATTTADSKGRFRFRKLPRGSYVVSVFVPGAGMTRRSVDVTPGRADPAGRVELTIPFSANTMSTPRPSRNRGTVSVSDLAIPTRAKHEFKEAQKRLMKQDVAGARRHLKQSVELAPRYTSAWNVLGAVESRAGDWAAAEACFRKALELRPGAVTTTLNLGGVLLYLGRARDAVEYNRLAVARAPDNALANYQLGMSYFMLRQDDEAVQYLNAAKNLDPATTRPHNCRCRRSICAGATASTRLPNSKTSWPCIRTRRMPRRFASNFSGSGVSNRRRFLEYSEAMRPIRLLLALVLAVCSLIAQGTPADDRIYDQVRMKLAADRDVNGGGIEVEVKNGVVTLQGKVHKEKQKQRAEHVAKKVKGVSSVVNNLKVEFP